MGEVGIVSVIARKKRNRGVEIEKQRNIRTFRERKVLC